MSASKSNTLNYAAPQTGGVRFAPSPTGRFHIGNLRTAWVSHTFARALGLPWVVRFEDIDRPRVLADALDLQLADMAALEMMPDLVLVQSLFESRHRDLFERARAEGAIYPCNCSRKEVQTALSELASASHSGVAPVYSGQCRQHPLVPNQSVNSAGIAWRFKMSSETGADDFIVARTMSVAGTDGFTPAYHWACAIDDFDGAYDLIVRSADLAPALPLQESIRHWIAVSENKTNPTIRAFHTSLVTQENGSRLEKRTAGVTLHELFVAGWTAPKLRANFDASFDSRVIAKVMGGSVAADSEPQASLRLSELLKSV